MTSVDMLFDVVRDGGIHRDNLAALDRLRAFKAMDVDGVRWVVDKATVTRGHLVAYVRKSGQGYPFWLSFVDGEWVGVGAYSVPLEVRDNLTAAVRGE